MQQYTEVGLRKDFILTTNQYKLLYRKIGMGGIQPHNLRMVTSP